MTQGLFLSFWLTAALLAGSSPQRPEKSGAATAAARAAAIETRREMVRERMRERFEEAGVGDELGPSGFDEWFYGQRAFPGGRIPTNAIPDALRHTARFNLPPASDDAPRTTAGLVRGVVSGPAWSFLGPAVIPDGQTDIGSGTTLSPVSGRVSAIAVDPGDANVVYAGGAHGGIWKTTNALAATPTWTALTDAEVSLATGTIAIDPVDTDILYVGTGEAAGSCDSYYGRGILRSTDGGTTWTQLNGGAPFNFLSVSKIVIDPTSAGSATTTTLFASVRLGNLSSGTSQCAGVPGTITGALFRSTDSGQTWTQLDVPTGLAGTEQIHDLVLNPSNANELLVGVRGITQTNAGVWRSTNALGVTPTFTHITAGFIQNSPAANPQTRRIRLAGGGAGAPSTVYAAVEGTPGSILWGVYRSSDFGLTWSHVDGTKNGTGSVTSGSATLNRTTGPPFTSALIGQRVILDNRTARRVASVPNGNQITMEATSNFTNAAVSWSIGSYPRFCEGQCFYDIAVGVDPTDATGNTVYIGGNPRAFAADLSGLTGSRSVWRSTDGGATWRGISQGDNTTGGVHTDVHVLALDGSTSPARLYCGNDGGVWRSNDQGLSWVTMNTNLGITQFQSVGMHPWDKSIVIGGTQDNGTNIRRPDLETPPAWFHTDFGDGGQSLIDQRSPQRMFHTYFNQANNFMGPAKSTTGGGDGPGNWVFTGAYAGYGGAYYNGMNPTDPVSFYAPVIANPSFSPSVILFGSNKVYRSPDPQDVLLGGSSWTPVSPVLTTGGSNFVSAIATFHHRIAGNEVIYTGASDGRVSRSANVNASTTGCPGACTSTWVTISGASTPTRFVTEIEVYKGDPTGNTAYVAFSGFDAGPPAFPGHLFKTTNGLSPTPTWTNITGNLPDIPVNAIAIDDSTVPKTLYVGTDIGVFSSTNEGTSWTYFNNGHPVVAVFGLDFNAGSGQLVSATHGRGMWELTFQTALLNDGFEFGDLFAWTANNPP